ncbi:MAG TPA: hypothetical protein VFZ11_15200 [Gemmatimonadaceae bacterium]|jgi:hypothetical protein
MRPLIPLATLLVAGCATFGWSGRDTLSTTVGVPADTAMRIASTQLRHHGYTVTDVSTSEIITAPRKVPQYLLPLSTNPEEAAELADRQLILSVRVRPAPYFAGSRIDVTGFLVPRATKGATNTVMEDAVLITEEDNPTLYREVRAAAGWISDALKRHDGK